MQIQPYKSNPQHLAQLVDLINYCQNTEAHLSIKMAEQSDIFDINSYYQNPGGQFWIALDKNQVVGSIALLVLNPHTAVLKKFFAYPQYRGQPHHLGRQLYQQLLTFASQSHITRIVLDTPEDEIRSHYFYEHHGFHQIDGSELQHSYVYPDRNSRFYELIL